MATSMPYVLCSKVNLFHLIVSVMIGSVIVSHTALATSCQVYPSEYAYHDVSVRRVENASANCTNYPPDNLQGGDHPEHYIHCNGTQLKLTDSFIGQQEYHTKDYYAWKANKDGKLLFIFQTAVSLTTITLHYHSDNFRGLPRLILYAVPDDFDIWDTPKTGYCGVNVTHHHSAVPSRVGTTGPRNISINVNFNTRKVLMYQFNSSFILNFAVSEVEFFTCNSSVQAESDSHYAATTLPENPENFAKTSSLAKTMSITVIAVQPNNATGVIIIGASIAIPLMLSVILIISVIVLIWSYKRRSINRKLYTDSQYSTLSKETGQQIQLKSMQQDSAQLDNQVHLSPSTGQTEFIRKPESANINSPNSTSQNSHPTRSTAGDEHSLVLNVAYQETLSSQTTCESTSEQPTYAVIDECKESKFKKQTKKEDLKCKAAEKGPPIPPYQHEVSSTLIQVTKEKADVQVVINSPNTMEELYTAVKKKSKGSDPRDEEHKIPPIPPHTIEELYTAVEKNPKSNADENKEAPSQIYLQNIAEDLYTTVTKKLKSGLTDGTEDAPPIPPHTVEELYTAVIKKPKESTEDKEKDPPIPPYVVPEEN